MKTLRGIPAAPGITLGPAFPYLPASLDVPRRRDADPAQELERLDRALSAARQQLAEILQKAREQLTEGDAAIFEAHALFLEDPALIEATRQRIRAENLNAEAALHDTVEDLAGQLEALGDETFQARAADVRDVGQRVLRNLLGVGEADLSTLAAPAIILASDLTPSDTIQLDRSKVLGFCTAEGGPTSHTAILAKALGLPAVVGAGSQVLEVLAGQRLALNGATGEVVIDPDPETERRFKTAQAAWTQAQAADLSHAAEPAVTADGTQVEVVANVGSLDDARLALDHGAEGIGLLRTEFLYLERRTAPDEEEQYAAYAAILRVMGARPVVVRTLDVGGDKELPYLDLGAEANPFLGWRAIRMCLDRPDFFKTQLRALIRASTGSDLRVMFPMISSLEEIRRAKELFKQAWDEVREAGHATAEKIQLGIMVEVPSAAIMADRFADEVDFFSIGTNDLTQYTFAAERTNERVANLGDPCHPAVLRLIEGVILAAHRVGIWVGLCGEMAGDPEAIPLLLGLGLDEFSMAPSLIPRAKAEIRRWTVEQARSLAERVTRLDNAEAVRALVRASSPAASVAMEPGTGGDA